MQTDHDLQAHSRAGAESEGGALPDTQDHLTKDPFRQNTLHTLEGLDRTAVPAMDPAWTTKETFRLHDDIPRAAGAKAESGHRGSKDRHDGCADSRCEVCRRTVIGDDDAASPDQLGRFKQRQPSRKLP